MSGFWIVGIGINVVALVAVVAWAARAWRQSGCARDEATGETMPPSREHASRGR